MMERLEGAALPLVLTLSLLADGLMEALGPSGFALVPAITLTAAEALRFLAGTKRKAPCITADQSTMQETTTKTHKGARCSHCTTAPAGKSRRTYRNA